MTAPTKALSTPANSTLDLSALVITDTEPVKVTRKRKQRELSPLAAHIKASFESGGKWKAVPAASEEHANLIKRTLRADATQMNLGLSIHVEEDAKRKGAFVVKFAGKQKRATATVVAAAPAPRPATK